MNSNKSLEIMNNYKNDSTIQGYGITYKYELNLYNLTDNTINFNYNLTVNPMYNIKIKTSNGFSYNDYTMELRDEYGTIINGDIWNEQNKQYNRNIQLDGNSCIHITLEVTQLTGSSATAVNKFNIK